MKKKKQKKNRLYLLKRDHTVCTTKKTIAEMRRDHELEKYQWILIPIQAMSSSYVPVDTRILSTLNFTDAEIRFHMKLKTRARAASVSKTRVTDDEFGMMGECWDTQDEDFVLWDYYTTSVTAQTVEEFYNAIYNILAFSYVKELQGLTDSDDIVWMDVVDLELTFQRDGRDTDHVVIRSEQGSEDVPFDCDVSDHMCASLVERFGIGLRPSQCNMGMPNLYFKSANDRTEWVATTSPIDLTRDVTTILVGNYAARSYVMLKAWEYDQLLRMQNGMMYISPIDMRYQDDFDYDMLAVAAYYKLLKYELRMWGGDEDLYEEPGTRVYHDYESMCDITNIQVLDTDDIIALVEHLDFVFKVFHESISVMISCERRANERCANDDDLFMPAQNSMDPHLHSTVFANLVIDITKGRESPTEDTQLVIYTDCYEDRLPNLQEMAYILKNDELSK